MNEELSLIDVLKIFKKLVGYLLGKKWKIIGFSFLLFGLLTYRHIRQKHSYAAEISFTTPDKGGGKLNSALAMARQFGILGGSSGGELSTSKIAELITTDKIVREALFTKAEVDGKQDLIINHFVEEYEMETDSGEVIHFSAVEDVFTLPRQKEKLVKNLSKSLRKQGIEVNVSDESGIIELVVNTQNPSLSIALSKKLVESLKRSYVETSIEKQKNTFNSLDNRVDSIRQTLDRAESEYAQLIDSKVNIIKAEGKLREGALMREIRILNVMYAEGIKNLELARFNLLSETPTVQVIDIPTLPIKSSKRGLLMASALNLFSAGVLTVMLFIGIFVKNYLKVKLSEVEG